MTEKKTWNARINITEAGSEVSAEAGLSGPDGEQLVGHGRARCNPRDENVPVIGDELAAARALSDLGRKLVENAAHDIEAHTHQPVDRLRT